MIYKHLNYKKLAPVLVWTFLVALCLLRYAQPIKDGDVLWHIKYGEYHIQQKTMLIDHSIFSWTPAKQYEPYCSWAADVLLYILFQAGGWPLLYVFLYAGLFFPVFAAGRFARKAGGSFHGLDFFILVILLLSLSTAAYMKPELLSLVFFALVPALYFNLKIDRLNERKGRLFLIFPLIFLLWANMHGVFFMGLILLAAIIAGELINYLTKQKESLPRSTVVILTVSGVLSVAATFLTPYGTDLIRHVLHLSTEGVNPGLAKEIIAFQSVAQNIMYDSIGRELGFWGIMAFSFVLLFAVNVKKKHEIDFGILLPTIYLALLGLTFLRSFYYWPPFWAFSFFYLAGKERVDLKSAMKYGKPVIRGGAIAFLVGIALFFSIRAVRNVINKPARFQYFGYGINEGVPVQASAFLKRYDFGKKLFNSFTAGSYLIFDLFPERKVFIDNRCFPYQGEVYEKYMAFRDGKISLEEMESEFDFDVAIVTNHEIVLNTFLSSNNWRPVFYGIGGVVLVRDDVQFNNDIIKLDRNRFNGLKNLVQAADVVRTAQNLNDLDSADYVIKLMKKNLSYQGDYDFFYSYCTLSQMGLRAYDSGDYDRAFDYLWRVGFNESNIRTNAVLKSVVNYKIGKYVNINKYRDAMPLIARLLNYYRDDADVMYDAGIIAYLASKQAKKMGFNVELPSWRKTLKQLIKMEPDYQYADIASQLLADKDIPKTLLVRPLNYIEVMNLPGKLSNH